MIHEVIERCAGIDVGKTFIVVSFRKDVWGYRSSKSALYSHELES
jgi:hypothetical protein